jgi:hypothetical protein
MYLTVCNPNACAPNFCQQLLRITIERPFWNLRWVDEIPLCFQELVLKIVIFNLLRFRDYIHGFTICLNVLLRFVFGLH